MIRIAFAFSPGSTWIGGLSYYSNLLSALDLVRKRDEYRLIGFLPAGDSNYESISRQFDEVFTIDRAGFRGKVKSYTARFLSERDISSWLSPETEVSRALRKIHADVVFLKEDPLANFRVPSLCWFPDFQSMHMPEMFTPEDLQVYTRVVRNMARFATNVMLSSESVRKDFVSVLPAYGEKVRVIPFVSLIDKSIYEENPLAVTAEYHLPERYFYLPNQLWKHKNHRIVLDALQTLKDKGRSVVVVASGPVEDNRNSSYPSEFIAEISRRNLRDNFILLGMVPRRHVYALLRQSIALLQPSLFEGWSSSIEEAKSLGKPVIASNLEVHLEQNPPRSVYFNKNDSKELAGCLELFDDTLKPGVDLAHEQTAHEMMVQRAKAFGESFLEMASHAAHKN